VFYDYRRDKKVVGVFVRFSCAAVIVNHRLSKLGSIHVPSELVLSLESSGMQDSSRNKVVGYGASNTNHSQTSF
jgi:hypothetical protein